MAQCTATSRRNGGKQCRAQAVLGATVCKMHGGSAPQVKAAARARILEIQLNGELIRQGWDPVTDPAAALLDQAGEVLAWQHLCRDRLAHLHRIDYTNDKGDEDVKPAIALYERAQDRAVNTLAKVISLGIQERVARSQELTAEANLQALRGLIRAARDTDATEDELLVGLLGGMM